MTLAGETLAADEVEIQATPRPGTAVAHDDGLVAVIDTTLTPELRAEGDARELTSARSRTCARRPSWTSTTGSCSGSTASAPSVEPFLASVARETLADELRREAPPSELPAATVRLERGEARIALRRTGDA